MTGPPLAWVVPSDPAACPTGVVCVRVRADPPHETASKAVDKQSRIRRSCASDSATNLHFYNGILRRLRGRRRESAETAWWATAWPSQSAGCERSARLLSFAAWSTVVGGNGEVVYRARVAG